MSSLKVSGGFLLGEVILSAACLIGGCTMPLGGPPMTQQVTKEDLREKLDRFEDSFEANVRGAAEAMVQADGSRRIKRLALIWQMRLMPMLRNAMDQDNPLGGFLDTWTLCVRMRQYLAEGEGKNLFGPNQRIAVTAAQACEAEIEQVGALILSPQMFDRARERVHAMAKDFPLRGEFSGTEVRTSQQASEEDVVLRGVLELPLAPFRWLGGVDATAQSIKEFTAVAARLTDVVQGLAADARLQIQLLLFDTEDLESVQSTVASLQKVSDSSERLAAVSEKLPGEIRRELTAMFDDIDARQPELRKTLGETRLLAEQLDPSGKSVAVAGEAWASTARAIQDMVASFRQPRNGNDARKAEPTRRVESRQVTTSSSGATALDAVDDGTLPPAYDINDYRRTAEALTETAKELQKLTADIKEISTSDAISARLEELSTQVQGLFTESTSKANAVTDHAAWRGLQLILVAFALALVYRLITVRWGRPQAR